MIFRSCLFLILGKSQLLTRAKPLVPLDINEIKVLYDKTNYFYDSVIEVYELPRIISF